MGERCEEALSSGRSPCSSLLSHAGGANNADLEEIRGHGPSRIRLCGHRRPCANRAGTLRRLPAPTPPPQGHDAWPPTAGPCPVRHRRWPIAQPGRATTPRKPCPPRRNRAADELPPLGGAESAHVGGGSAHPPCASSSQMAARNTHLRGSLTLAASRGLLWGARLAAGAPPPLSALKRELGQPGPESARGSANM